MLKGLLDSHAPSRCRQRGDLNSEDVHTELEIPEREYRYASENFAILSLAQSGVETSKSGAPFHAP